MTRCIYKQYQEGYQSSFTSEKQNRESGNIFLIPFCTVFFFTTSMLLSWQLKREKTLQGFPSSSKLFWEKTPNPLRKTPFYYFSFPNPTSRNSLNCQQASFQSWLWKMNISSMIYPASKPNQLEKATCHTECLSSPVSNSSLGNPYLLSDTVRFTFSTWFS